LMCFDTDVLLLRRPDEIDFSQTYMAEVYPGISDMCITFNGGDKSFFDRYLQQSIQPGYVRGSIATLCSNQGRYVIPFEYFVHFGSVAIPRTITHDEVHWHRS
jgi:hypothetical protein